MKKSKQLSILLLSLMLVGLTLVLGSCKECSHEWTLATCTIPKTCKLCQVTEGSALGHNWTEASCTAPKTCLSCQTQEGNSIGHTWVEATCSTPKACSICQTTEGSIIDHNYVNGACTMCNIEDPLVSEHKIGKEIYDTLNEINDLSTKISSSVYDAWYFAIYEADNDSYLFDVDSAIQDFSIDVGISKSIIKTAIDKYISVLGLDKLGYDLDIVRITVLESIDGAVDVVLLAYDIMGTTDTIDTNFAKIKDLLKQMSPEYEQYTEISKLKKFYSDSLSFYEFVSSPSGSFSQLAPTINGHISSLKQQKNDLSFVYED